MAIEAARMQQFRGAYADFDASKLLPGQFAVVTSGDPNTQSGTALYLCFMAGSAKRLTGAEDLQDVIGTSWPDTAGNAGQILQTNGDGTTSWVNKPSGSGGGVTITDDGNGNVTIS